jgi:nucleoside-diphosphate-sugar epimerase
VTNLVLGCGFTGARVVRLLAARGERVLATVGAGDAARAAVDAGGEPITLDADDEASREALARRCAGEPLRVLVALPPARLPGGGERTAAVLRALAGRVLRVVQLSSTVVYGAAARVDETTPACPAGERGRLYLEAEAAVRAGPWSSLVLRAAAIYGPGRGVLAEGGPRFTHARSLDAVVSRIHADDLAALAAAALATDVVGAYPAADEEPASGRQLLAAWAGEAWAPRPGAPAPAGSRRVDGSAIVRALGVQLRYPSFRDALGEPPRP